MHVPGVKQELPDTRPGLSAPLLADVVVRDARNTRLMKMSREDPRTVIRSLTSLMRKMNGGRVFVDATVREGGGRRVLNLEGEDDTAKVVRKLNSLSKKIRNRTEENVVLEEAVSSDDPEGVTS